MKDLIRILPFVLFMAFLALGPLPISLGGVRFDYLVTFACLCVLAFRLNPGVTKWVSAVNAIVVCLVVSWIPSVIFSGNISYSFYRYLAIIPYVLFFLGVRRAGIKRSEYLFLWVTSIILIVFMSIAVMALSNAYPQLSRLYLSLDYQSLLAGKGSFESQSVDPNMTGMGLSLLFVFSLSGIPIFVQKRYQNSLPILLFLMLLLADVRLGSRTALLMTLMSSISYFFFLNIGNAVRFFSVASFLAVAVVFSVYNSDVMMSRLNVSGIIQAGQMEGGRISLMNEHFELFFRGWLTLFHGLGFGLYNPHNEFLRTLVCSGIFSAVLFTLLIVILFNEALRRKWYKHKANIRGVGYSAVLSVLVMFMTYGHTKTLWVGLLLVWLVSGPLQREGLRLP